MYGTKITSFNWRMQKETEIYQHDIRTNIRIVQVTWYWYFVILSSNKKRKNAPIIFDLTGVEGYKGRADQRQALFSQITKENYQEMRERIKKLPSDDTIEGSTNWGRFIEYFTMDDGKWIQTINNALEG